MMAKDFEVKPGFGFYQDGEHRNAKAWNQSKISGTQHGTIAFGANFLRALLSMEDGDIAVAAVCAHEFGHVYQYNSGHYRQLLKNTPGFCTELHADYLAGWFLAKLKSRRPTIRLRQAGIVIESLGSSDFSTERFHGRPDQRKHAIEKGFFDCKGTNFSMTIAVAAKTGYDYLWEKYTD